MKLELDFDSSETVEEAVFIAMLKKELREAKQALSNDWHKDDIKQHKKIIKACKVLLDYYGQQTTERDKLQIVILDNDND